jgi:hypothetical protein
VVVGVGPGNIGVVVTGVGVTTVCVVGDCGPKPSGSTTVVVGVVSVGDVGLVVVVSVGLVVVVVVVAVGSLGRRTFVRGTQV